MEALYLVKNGVPWDVAIEMDAAERLGMVVILGRFDGNEFDWQAGRWKSGNGS